MLSLDHKGMFSLDEKECSAGMTAVSFEGRHAGEGQYLYGSQRNAIDPSLRWDDVPALE